MIALGVYILIGIILLIGFLILNYWVEWANDSLAIAICTVLWPMGLVMFAVLAISKITERFLP
jgi:hypothetical protein